jgi:hypothetical protein
MIDQQIPGQPGQPNNEQPLARPEALQVLEHPQEDVLRQILRPRIAIGETVTNRVHTPGVHPHQVFPSGFLAAQAALYELGIRIQAIARPDLRVR